MMPKTEHDTTSEPLEENQVAAYYCRGCGRPLPQGSSAHFHPKCLKADKRRRMADQRQREAQRFHTWLQRCTCPQCGSGLGELAKVNPQPSIEMACEASQGDAEPLNFQVWLDCPRNHD